MDAVISSGSTTLSYCLRYTERGTRVALGVHEGRPVAAVLSHDDFVRLAEIERRDAQVSELLAERGYPGDLSTEGLLELLSSTLGSEVCRGGR